MWLARVRTIQVVCTVHYTLAYLDLSYSFELSS